MVGPSYVIPWKMCCFVVDVMLFAHRPYDAATMAVYVGPTLVRCSATIKFCSANNVGPTINQRQADVFDNHLTSLSHRCANIIAVQRCAIVGSMDTQPSAKMTPTVLQRWHDNICYDGPTKNHRSLPYWVPLSFLLSLSLLHPFSCMHYSQLGIERVSSMYSLTFCVRVMLPERHNWKPAVQADAVNVENAPRRRPVTGQPATPTSHIWRAILRTPPVTRRSPASSASRPRRVFALCCHMAGWTQACNYQVRVMLP